MANFLYLKDLEKKWTSTENHPDTQSLLEADVEAVATVRPRKPSKCCLIIASLTGIFALFYILVGVAIVVFIWPLEHTG